MLDAWRCRPSAATCPLDGTFSLAARHLTPLPVTDGEQTAGSGTSSSGTLSVHRSRFWQRSTCSDSTATRTRPGALRPPGQRGKPPRTVWARQAVAPPFQASQDGWSPSQSAAHRTNSPVRGAILEKLVRDRARPVPLKIRPASRSVPGAGSSQPGSGAGRAFGSTPGDGGRSARAAAPSCCEHFLASSSAQTHVQG